MVELSCSLVCVAEPGKESSFPGACDASILIDVHPVNVNWLAAAALRRVRISASAGTHPSRLELCFPSSIHPNVIKSEQPDDPEDLSAAQTFIRAPREPHTAVPTRL